MALISKSAWAKKHGVTKGYVSHLLKQGKIQAVDGLIDEEKTDYELSCLRNPDLPTKRQCEVLEDGDSLPVQYLKTKLKNEIERGKLLEAKVKSEMGELISAEKVRQAMFAKGRIIRDGILNVPDRVSSLIATINDASQIHEILMKELREVLEELSRDDT
jgi:hypothetical protein